MSAEKLLVTLLMSALLFTIGGGCAFFVWEPAGLLFFGCAGLSLVGGILVFIRAVLNDDM